MVETVFTELSWTCEACFMLQPLLKILWPRAWELLGQVQHLFCSKARQSWDGEVNGAGRRIRGRREDRAPGTGLRFRWKAC